MPVQLSHIGEDLIAEMLASLADRQQLSQVVCSISGRSLADDINEGHLGDTVTFRADDASIVVHTDEKSYSCDGEQTVDVLCAGRKNAIAFEAKLGETRMGNAEFYRRFCIQCEESKHADSRLSGSMVAVLERSLPFGSSSRLIAHAEGFKWTLAKPWWLVIRQSVYEKWRKGRTLPVSSARVLSFDTLAETFGSRQQFDQLVQRVVGTDFAGRWRIPFGDPS